MRISENILNIIIIIFLLTILFFGFYDLYIKYDLNISIKLDTILIVTANLLIAYWISSIINKKHKNEELKVSNCFKELEYISDLVIELREVIKKKNLEEDNSNRFMSLLNLQIDLINKYKFINDEHKNKLTYLYQKLDIELTSENNINEEYKHTLLFIEKRILVIKSDILK